MQTASKQASFGIEHGLSMRQHDHHPEHNDNNESQGIAEIIIDLAQSASEDKETINSVLTTMTATIKYFQEKMMYNYVSVKM